jgi:hypothetical protein
MKRLIIIVEGDTEKEFVKTILTPYLNNHGIYSIDCFKIKHSKGGLTTYSHLKKDVLNCIHETNTIITTLIDFYALPQDFPNYLESTEIPDKNKRLNFLEKSIVEEIENSKSAKFPNLIPYIQLHEFEALIFSSPVGIDALFTKDQIDFQELNKIFDLHENPEEINNDPLTAPSKRLIKHIRGYNKIVDGVLILDEIGLETVLKKCPRFSYWVQLIIAKVSE